MSDRFEALHSELTARLREINDISSAVALLQWDQTTYMPPGGTPARGRQIATLQRIAHEKFADKAIGELLDALEPALENRPSDDDDAALLRIVRREFERAIKIPARFMAEVSSHFAVSYDRWTIARPANDFDVVRPMLEKTLDFSREYAELFPGRAHIADPLIERTDFGMTVASLRPLFNELRPALAEMVKVLMAQPPVDGSFLHRTYPKTQQWKFGIDVIRAFGYDFTRGRQDRTHHPFMTKFSLGDVRITTRVYEKDLSSALFSTMHEAGHALYEQGIDRRYEATPLASGTSSGVHESQSRLWENLVGRSRHFWRRYYPQLHATFPDQLAGIEEDDFYRAINRVRPSLIRVEADEVTYNLHVLIRFELELALLEGKVRVADLPQAWAEHYESLLGLQPPTDADGVLQDVHWFADFIGGAFQGYTLGNILAAQYYAKALENRPSIPAEIQEGDFTGLHAWLQENIYRHGSKFTTDELTKRITGGPVHLKPYLDYLRTKYAGIYRLSLAQQEPSASTQP